MKKVPIVDRGKPLETTGKQCFQRLKPKTEQHPGNAPLIVTWFGFSQMFQTHDSGQRQRETNLKEAHVFMPTSNDECRGENRNLYTPPSNLNV